MKHYEFRIITIKNAEDMIKLIIDRQNRESEFYTFLKNSCLNEEYLAETLKQLFENHTIAGVGAFDGKELMGFILGRITVDTERGRHVWVPYEGSAIRYDQSSELIRNLYANVSVLWLNYGCFKHYVMAPLGDKRYYEAFQRLGFAIEQVHGVMYMGGYKYFTDETGLKIRTGNKNDKELLSDMSKIIFSYQNSAPTYAPALPEMVLRIKEGYREMADDEEAVVLLAEKNSSVLGFQAYWPQLPCLMAPDRAVELSIAGTYPSQRGIGVGKKLMNEGHRIMSEKGYSFITTDWRIANLASSTFWPGCGFKEVAYRLVRTIDESLGWANFNNPVNNI